MFASPLLLAPAALVVGGLASEAALARRDLRRHPAPGRMVEVGGHRLHARVLGEGDPVIVLEAGAGEWSSHWGRLPEDLCTLSKVVAYDRAGLGWSASGPAPRDAETAAVELRELLRKLAPRRKALIVAHGWGSHVARVFAARYPLDTAGLVLVDGQREELEAELAAAGLPSAQASTRLLTALSALGRLGVLRLARYSPLPPAEGLALARSQVETIAALARSPRVLSGMRAELVAARASGEQVTRSQQPLEIPVRALVAEASLASVGTPAEFPREAFNDLWRELGARFARLSPAAAVELVPGSDHHLQLRRPELVLRAVAGLLDVLRRA